MIKLGVIFGGPTVEHEVSIISAIQAMNNLDKDKYDVYPIYVTKDRTRLGDYKLSDDAARMAKENQEGINSDMYIPKHFYTPTDYEVEE